MYLFVNRTKIDSIAKLSGAGEFVEQFELDPEGYNEQPLLVDELLSHGEDFLHLLQSLVRLSLCSLQLFSGE